jgi:hypothetical protein
MNMEQLKEYVCLDSEQKAIAARIDDLEPARVSQLLSNDIASIKGNGRTSSKTSIQET